MDPVSALGVAAAAVQFLQFSLSALKICKEIRDNGKKATEANEQLEEHSEIIKKLENDINSGVSDPSLKTLIGKRITKIANECQQTAKELISLLQQVRGAGSQKTLKTLQSTFRALKEKKTIEKLENRLKEQQNLLRLILEADIRKRVDVLAVEQTEHFNSLQAYQKLFIQELEKQHEKIIHSQKDHSKTVALSIRSSQFQIEDSVRKTVKKSENTIIQKLEEIHEDISISHKKSLEYKRSPRQDAQQIEIIVSKLRPVEDAAFNCHYLEHEPLCQEGTRVELLQVIEDWVSNSPKSECIFWLSGMAGTGKSTISRTMAKIFDDKGHLGASFFFSRGRHDLSQAVRLFGTLAAQLARKSDSLRSKIWETADKYDDISFRSLPEQWDRLIWQPLKTLDSDHHAIPINLVLIIDALDECESDNDVRVVLRQVRQLNELQNSRIRAIVTSRPEISIRREFHITPEIHFHSLVLHDIERRTVQRDIESVIRHELGLIRVDFGLLPDWPSERDVQILAEKAETLFIYAATACRFVGSYNPKARLRDVLSDKFPGHSSTKQLDGIYSQVLESGILSSDANDLKDLQLEMFRRIVGSIVTSFSPLSVSSLSSLLSLDEEEHINPTLAPLHSLLRIPVSSFSPIEIFHTSFRDYLLTPGRSPQRFSIDKSTAHKDLTNACLRLLSNELYQDMCDLNLPGILHSEILNDLKEEKIRPHLQYACCYWVKHMEEAVNGGCQSLDMRDIDYLEEFFKTKILFWVEVMSLLGKIAEAIHSINSLLQLFRGAEETAHLLALASDLRRFVLTNKQAIELAPLQLYSSALISSPEESFTVLNFSHCIPPWFRKLQPRQKQWDRCLSTLTAHRHRVECVTFSSDGQLIVSGSSDGTVRIWDSTTGQEQAILHHGIEVTSVAISRDSSYIAAAEVVRGVQLWEYLDGEFVKRAFVQCWLDFSSIVEFSPVGNLVAISLYNSGIMLWHLTSSQSHPETVLIGNKSQARKLAFSPDGGLVATLSSDGSVRIFDPAGAPQYLLALGEQSSRSDLRFSSNSKLVVYGVNGDLIKAFDLETGEEKVTGRLFSDLIDDDNDVIIAPDGQTAAKVRGSSILVLDISSQQQDFLLCGSGDILSISFCPATETLVLGSTGSAVEIWDLKSIGQGKAERSTYHFNIWNEENLRVRENGPISQMKLSPRGNLIAASTHFGAVELWSINQEMANKVIYGPSGVRRGSYALTFSSDGTLVASCNDFCFGLWECQSGRCLHWAESLKEVHPAVKKFIAVPMNSVLWLSFDKVRPAAKKLSVAPTNVHLTPSEESLQESDSQTSKYNLENFESLCLEVSQSLDKDSPLQVFDGWANFYDIPFLLLPQYLRNRPNVAWDEGLAFGTDGPLTFLCFDVSSLIKALRGD